MTDMKAARAAAEILQAISEPTRLRIIRALAQGSKNVTEMAKLLNVEIVNVSHHLGVLRSAGLVVDEKVGRFVVYKLDEAKFSTTSHWVLVLDAGWCTVNFKPDAAGA